MPQPTIPVFIGLAPLLMPECGPGLPPAAPPFRESSPSRPTRERHSVGSSRVAAELGWGHRTRRPRSACPSGCQRRQVFSGTAQGSRRRRPGGSAEQTPRRRTRAQLPGGPRWVPIRRVPNRRVLLWSPTRPRLAPQGTAGDRRGERVVPATPRRVTAVPGRLSSALARVVGQSVNPVCDAGTAPTSGRASRRVPPHVGWPCKCGRRQPSGERSS